MLQAIRLEPRLRCLCFPTPWLPGHLNPGAGLPLEVTCQRHRGHFSVSALCPLRKQVSWKPGSRLSSQKPGEEELSGAAPCAARNLASQHFLLLLWWEPLPI